MEKISKKVLTNGNTRLIISLNNAKWQQTKERTKMKTNKPEEKLGYNILLYRAEKEGVSQEAVNTLLRYYTDTLGWGMNEALNYTIELFDNGTIAQIKALNKEAK